MPEWKLPTLSQRVAVVGRTGSGKTQFGAWLLSQAPFNLQPYVIINSKGDPLLDAITRAPEIGLKDFPSEPGLFMLRAGPQYMKEIEDWLWGVHQRGGIGIFVDEAYNMPNWNALRAVLTQGRSLSIPMINLSQRPVDVPRSVFSEADHLSVFHLNDERDEEIVEKIVPRGFLSWLPDGMEAQDNVLPPMLAEIAAKRGSIRLKRFHSRWYDVVNDAAFAFKPVSDAKAIVEKIQGRLSPAHRVI